MADHSHIYCLSACLVQAFEIMVNKGISGLAVVDEDGIIIHNTSTSDLKVCGLLRFLADTHAFTVKISSGSL